MMRASQPLILSSHCGAIAAAVFVAVCANLALAADVQACDIGADAPLESSCMLQMAARRTPSQAPGTLCLRKCGKKTGKCDWCGPKMACCGNGNKKNVAICETGVDIAQLNNFAQGRRPICVDILDEVPEAAQAGEEEEEEPADGAQAEEEPADAAQEEEEEEEEPADAAQAEEEEEEAPADAAQAEGGEEEEPADAAQAEEEAEEEAADDMNFSAPDLSENHCKPGSGPHMRTRWHIFDLSFDKWTLVKSSWRKLYAGGGYKKFADEHTRHYADIPSEYQWKDHNKALGFLPFHRGQIQDLETFLQNVSNDCSLTLPYWNWALDVGNFMKCDIWTDEYFGEPKGCITKGLPAGWTYPSHSSKWNGDCIERKVKGHPQYTLKDLETIVEHEKKMASFSQEIESVHNGIHSLINGNMGSKVGKASPSEPLFYMHHAFMDQLYFSWQLMNKEVANNPCKEFDCDARPDHKAWAGRVHGSCIFLPVGRKHFLEAGVKGNEPAPNMFEVVGAQGSTCVDYKIAVNSRKDGNLHKCAALEYQIEKGMCSEEDLLALQCVDSAKCKHDLSAAQAASALFVNDAVAAKAADALLADIDKLTHCEKYGQATSYEEQDLCLKCTLCKEPH